MSATVTLSPEGQLLLPQAVRERRGWKAGDRLTVEETAEGVLLKPELLFPPTRMEDVFGMAKYEGPPISVEQMEKAVLDEAAARWGRFQRTGTDYENDGLD